MTVRPPGLTEVGLTFTETDRVVDEAGSRRGPDIARSIRFPAVTTRNPPTTGGALGFEGPVVAAGLDCAGPAMRALVAPTAQQVASANDPLEREGNRPTDIANKRIRAPARTVLIRTAQNGRTSVNRHYPRARGTRKGGGMLQRAKPRRAWHLVRERRGRISAPRACRPTGRALPRGTGSDGSSKARFRSSGVRHNALSKQRWTRGGEADPESHATTDQMHSTTPMRAGLAIEWRESADRLRLAKDPSSLANLLSVRAQGTRVACRPVPRVM
jgi:hypothetical protein